MRDGCAGFFTAGRAGRRQGHRPAVARFADQAISLQRRTPTPSDPGVAYSSSMRIKVDALRRGDFAMAFGSPFDSHRSCAIRCRFPAAG